MTVVMKTELAQSYIAQARSSGRCRPRRASSGPPGGGAGRLRAAMVRAKPTIGRRGSFTCKVSPMATSRPARTRFTVAELSARLPGPAGERFAVAFERGTLSLELYAPRGHDPQKPHTRDEV